MSSSSSSLCLHHHLLLLLLSLHTPRSFVCLFISYLVALSPHLICIAAAAASMLSQLLKVFVGQTLERSLEQRAEWAFVFCLKLIANINGTNNSRSTTQLDLEIYRMSAAAAATTQLCVCKRQSPSTVYEPYIEHPLCAVIDCVILFLSKKRERKRLNIRCADSKTNKKIYLV